MTVGDVLDAATEYTSHEIRLTAPAMIVVLEVDSPPRVEPGRVFTNGDADALRTFLDADPLALDIRYAFGAAENDDPLLKARRERYEQRLEQATTKERRR
jgi:hypothetical protein